jgi:hypothetical protein
VENFILQIFQDASNHFKIKLKKFVFSIELIMMNYIIFHCFACFFYFMGIFGDGKTGWINVLTPEYSPRKHYLKVYLNSIYFVITSITTVGYGDFRATRSKEFVFVIVLLLSGQLLFSFVSGTLRSTMMSKDDLTLDRHVDEMKESMELMFMKL